MKYLLLCFFSSIGLSQGLYHWIDDVNKTVHFVPRVEISLSLVEAKVSEQQWARLVVDTEYTDKGLNNDPYYQKLRRKFKGYSFKAINPELDFSGLVNVKIQTLDKEKSVQLLPGILGPYFHVWFDLNKSQTEKLRKSLSDKQDLVQVSAKVIANLKINKEVERFSRPNYNCERLFQSGDSTFKVLEQYFSLISKLKLNSFKYQETFENFKLEFLNRCLMQDLNTPVRSFKDLLGSKLYLNDHDGPIVGRTIKVKRKSESIELLSIQKTFKELR